MANTLRGIGGLFVVVGSFLNYILVTFWADVSPDPILRLIRILVTITSIVMGLLIWTESTVAAVVSILIGCVMVFGIYIDVATLGLQPGPLWGHIWVDALLVLVGGFLGLPLGSKDQAID